MKNPEAINILKACYNGEFYHIPSETGLYLIQEYILELKGVRVDINPPDNMFSLTLYNTALNKIFEHYLAE